MIILKPMLSILRAFTNKIPLLGGSLKLQEFIGASFSLNLRELYRNLWRFILRHQQAHGFAYDGGKQVQSGFRIARPPNSNLNLV
jgi:hypothetical protein